MNKEPSQIAVEAAKAAADDITNLVGEVFKSGRWNPIYFGASIAIRIEDAIQSAIDKATKELREYKDGYDEVVRQRAGWKDRAEKAEAACAAWRKMANTLRLYVDHDGNYGALTALHEYEQLNLQSTSCGSNYVPIEDVKPLIDRLASDIGYSHCGELCAFTAKYGDKLK